MLTVGEILHKARLYKRISLSEISQETKINKKYLRWIERNELEHFDSPTHLYGFVKNFAAYIGVDEKKITAIYKRQVDRRHELKGKPKKKGFAFPTIILTYRSLAIVGVALFVLSIFGYLVVQFYRLQQPPHLELVKPTETVFTTNQESITLEGATEKNVYLTINGVQIVYDDNGTFSVPFTLKSGINTINVKAQFQSNQSKETTTTLTVTYDSNQPGTEPVANASGTPTPTPGPNTDMKVTLQIGNDVAWVQAVIDDIQKAVGVLDPKTKEDYVAKEHFFIITGRPAITTVTVNGEKKEWVNRDKSWIIECELQNGAVVCK